MIAQAEISRRAAEWHVPDRTVERDYVLTWLIHAMDQEFGRSLIFKGGTCLRKVWAPGWRFSEDLDYTAPVPLLDAFLREKVALVCQNLARSGFDAELIDGDWNAKRDQFSGEIRYVGPLRRTATPHRAKLDISFDERLLTQAVRREIHAAFTDHPQGAAVWCYDVEEIVAEKVRSLRQRSEPRDLYDLYMLLTQPPPTFKFDADHINELCMEKFAHKGLRYEGVVNVLDDKKTAALSARWNNRLGDQVPDLCSCEDARRSVVRSFTGRTSRR